MRIIKFRGKSQDTGEWVYGDLLKSYLIYLGGKTVEKDFYIMPCELQK